MKADFSKNTNSFYAIAETSPQVVLAVLRQLVNETGVEEDDIYVGDPMKNVYQSYYEMWHAEFPDVNVLGNDIHYDLNLAGRHFL
jgi:hypothetical protein